MLFTSPGGIINTFMDGGMASLTFSVKLFVIYAVWMSVMKVLEKSGLDIWVARLLNPITKRLFKNESEECYKNINLNLSANLLGMGGAATPLGIRAVELMENQKNKIMLVVINATSIQLIPTTILSMRAAMGATEDIMLPTLIVNIASTVTAVALVSLLVRK
jgi:spore maturation protein A